MAQAYIGMGSNLGKREDFLRRATALLAERGGELVALSSFYQTRAWGMDNAPDFLNAVLLLKTDLEPEALLELMLELEQELGRVRSKSDGYENRSIDLDLLFYDDLVLETEDLSLPHPAIAKRRFVLEPLTELAPELQHPSLNQSMEELLHACTDETAIEKWTSPTATSA